MLPTITQTSATTLNLIPDIAFLDENDALRAYNDIGEIFEANIALLGAGNMQLLGEYFRLYLGIHPVETRAFKKYWTRVVPTSQEIATTPAHVDTEFGIFTQEAVSGKPEKYMSVSEAIRQQLEIHNRLMAEIDEGLEAEARYLRLYDIDGE